MSTSDKPHTIRRAAKRSVPTATPGLRRGSEKRVARWVDAGEGEATKPTGAMPAGQVIRLSWADTFGRPARPDFGGWFRTTPTTAQVLPFRERTVQQHGGDQPSVPVLR